MAAWGACEFMTMIKAKLLEDPAFLPCQAGKQAF
jgi:hypothetical protein